MTKNPLNTLKYDPALCNGCALCATVCPHAVFVMRDHKAQISRYEACMECGACQLNCATGALQVESGAGCAYLMMREAIQSKFNRQENSVN